MFYTLDKGNHTTSKLMIRCSEVTATLPVLQLTGFRLIGAIHCQNITNFIKTGILNIDIVKYS